MILLNLFLLLVTATIPFVVMLLLFYPFTTVAIGMGCIIFACIRLILFGLLFYRYHLTEQQQRAESQAKCCAVNMEVVHMLIYPFALLIIFAVSFYGAIAAWACLPLIPVFYCFVRIIEQRKKVRRYAVE